MPRHFFLSRCIRNHAGTTAIEVAIVLPVFLLLLMACLEFSLIMFLSFAMENAMQDAVRVAKTQAHQTGQVEKIRETLLSRTFGLMDGSRLFITTDLAVDTGAGYSTAPEPCEGGGTCPCAPGVGFTDLNDNGKCDGPLPPLDLGGPGDLVTYMAFYQRPTLTPGLTDILGFEFPITSAILVRNEP